MVSHVVMGAAHIMDGGSRSSAFEGASPAPAFTNRPKFTNYYRLTL